VARFRPDDDYYRLQRLSWSGYNTYRNRCPRSYKFRYVDRKKVPRNEYNTIGGKVIQKVFERFYNDEIWRRGAEVSQILQDILPKEYEAIVRRTNVDWDAKESKLSKEELLESLVPLVPSTLALIKEHKLLGRYARSEVTVQAWVDKVLVHGISDFIIRREKEHIILDGKLTKHRSKYLKVDQLIWYVMLFYLQHRVLVQKVGWIYYTYGELEWVPVTMKDVKRLHSELEETIGLIKKNRFDATPSREACRFCDYKKLCPEGQDMDLTHKKVRAEAKQKEYEKAGSPLAKDIDGIEEIGF